MIEIAGHVFCDGCIEAAAQLVAERKAGRGQRAPQPPEQRLWPSTLKGRRLTFRMEDAALLQRLGIDRRHDRDSTVCLLSAVPIQEFTGRLDSVRLVKVDRRTNGRW